MALGVAAAQFVDVVTPFGLFVVRGFSTLLIGTGVLLVAVGVRRYFVAAARIDDERFRPARVSVVASSAVALAVGVLATLVVWQVRSR